MDHLPGHALPDPGRVRIPVKAASIPLRIRPPFRSESGHRSGGKAASKNEASRGE